MVIMNSLKIRKIGYKLRPEFLSQVVIPNWKFIRPLIEANKLLTDKERYAIGTAYHSTWHDDGYYKAHVELLNIGKKKFWNRIWFNLYLTYSDEIDTDSIYDLPAFNIGWALALREQVSQETYDVFTLTWRRMVGRIHPDDEDVYLG